MSPHPIMLLSSVLWYLGDPQRYCLTFTRSLNTDVHFQDVCISICQLCPIQSLNRCSLSFTASLVEVTHITHTLVFRLRLRRSSYSLHYSQNNCNGRNYKQGFGILMLFSLSI